MKKMVSIISCIILSTAVSSVSAANLSIMIDHEPVSFEDSAAYIDLNNNVMIPIRAVSEYLGYNVGWLEKTNSVTISGNDIDIKFYVNSAICDVNGTDVQLKTPVVNNNGRTYLEYYDLISMLDNRYIAQYTKEDGIINIFQGNEFTATPNGIIDWRGNIVEYEELKEQGYPDAFIESLEAEVEALQSNEY